MIDTFPIPEGANYSYADAWTSAHQGTDIFASRGQPVVAVAPGMARATNDPKGGKVVYLTGDDGWRFYYAHLDAWAPELEPDAQPIQVESGAFLGQVGTTGNAEGTAPHLHFQAAPPGSGAVDPFALLQSVDPKFSAPAPSPGAQPPKTSTAKAALVVTGVALVIAVGAAAALALRRLR